MTEFSAPLPILARYAIMVDVGYIYAAAGELLLGANSRREYRVDAPGLIQELTRNAESKIRGELLRVYWYDAARDRVPTIDQRVIAQMPWVKLRLGNLNARGQQKGVDAQIRADMEALARHRAITDAVLVAGDEDMVPAVEAAQAYGVGFTCGESSRPTAPTRRSGWSGSRTRSRCSTRPSSSRTSPASRSPRPSLRGWTSRRRRPSCPRRLSCSVSGTPPGSESGSWRTARLARPARRPPASSGPTGNGSRSRRARGAEVDPDPR